ncbi:hypothetical protein B0T24DRAFT_535135, partial [Lasiosphaeria ovina]
LTIPTFRHGPIRLNKADLLAGKSTAAFDNTLDWTAFQMAIIGGVGDFFGESTDYSKPSNAKFNDQDDIVDWFAGFGFDGPGALISAADNYTEARDSTSKPRKQALESRCYEADDRVRDETIT